MIRHAHKGCGLAVVSALLLSGFPAYADIGGIGSPVQGDVSDQTQQAQEQSNPDNLNSPALPPSEVAKYGNLPANAEILPANDAEYRKVITAVRKGDTSDSYTNISRTSNTSSDPAAATNSDDAVMIIRFNQQYVYFDNPLRKVVSKVSTTRPNARYELESVIPRGNNGYENEKYNQNLQNVVNVLAKYGVTGDRVSSRVIVSDSLKSQQINIFVR
jgi:hypothetical protein